MKPKKFVKVPKKQIKVALSHGIRKVGGILKILK
jgi:hypothetical protein